MFMLGMYGTLGCDDRGRESDSRRCISCTTALSAVRCDDGNREGELSMSSDESPEGSYCSLLHRWDVSHFSNEPSNFKHLLQAPHTLPVERIHVRSPCATILFVKSEG